MKFKYFQGFEIGLLKFKNFQGFSRRVWTLKITFLECTKPQHSLAWNLKRLFKEWRVNWHKLFLPNIFHETVLQVSLLFANMFKGCIVNITKLYSWKINRYRMLLKKQLTTYTYDQTFKRPPIQRTTVFSVKSLKLAPLVNHYHYFEASVL